MDGVFDALAAQLRRLPGLGARSAERIALHLVVERPERLGELVAALNAAAEKLRRCTRCGNLCEGELCPVCLDPSRKQTQLCIVEQVPDLLAMERAGGYRGLYHVLHGRLSPLRGVGPEQLNFAALKARLEGGEIEEVILALGNDIESEATCHYLREYVVGDSVRLTRIGFGLPSGGIPTFADAATLRSALDSRRELS